MIVLSLSIERPITYLKQRSTKSLVTKEWEIPNNIRDIRHLLSMYDSFVPVIGRTSNVSYLDIRRDMFDIGIYPGVEYRITDIKVVSSDASSDASISSLIGKINKKINDRNTKTPFITNNNDIIDYDYNDIIDNDDITIINDNDIILSVRPVYPLIDELERPWPISISLNQVPYYLTKGMYNSITVLGSLFISVSFFITCFILSNIFTFSFVNSRSMEPTIYPKDLILVEKISPFITRDLLHIPSANIGDVIFFNQPPKLVEYISEQENKEEFKLRRKTLSSDLIVKRVKEVIKDDNNHYYYDVRGDNPDYSVDSRIFGKLDEKYVRGRPLIRIYPSIGILSKNIKK